MSQIDKAFLSAYAKKRPTNSSSNEVQSLVDPTGERLLKIHLSSASSMQPHIEAEVPRPGLAKSSSEHEPQALAALGNIANSTLRPAPDASTNNSVHISQSSARIASMSSVRRESVELPESSRQSPPIASSVEPPARKTLTSYLNQARQPTAPAAPLPTRWSTAQKLRIDAPHSTNPAVKRPAETVPWSFGVAERGVKATADSKSVSARMNNQSTKPGPTKPVVSNPAAAKTAVDAHGPAKLRSDQPMSHAAKVGSTIESQRSAPPLGKSLNAESLAKLTLPIQPSWEVDEFLWPNATVNLLVTQSDAFHEIGLHLQHAQSKGLRVLSITSGERGVGRSTVAMCLAKTMSKLGLRIGLVDGDYECPSLVDQLNLESQHGWQQCLFENIPLDEVAIHSVDEAITLFPLTDSIAGSQVGVHAIRINKLIRRIANACDMVIIDSNRVTQKQNQLLGTGDDAVLDAALLVVDAELSLRQRVDAAVELVRHQGVQSIGLVENFNS